MAWSNDGSVIVTREDGTVSLLSQIVDASATPTASAVAQMKQSVCLVKPIEQVMLPLVAEYDPKLLMEHMLWGHWAHCISVMKVTIPPLLLSHAMLFLILPRLSLLSCLSLLLRLSLLLQELATSLDQLDVAGEGGAASPSLLVQPRLTVESEAAEDTAASLFGGSDAPSWQSHDDTKLKELLKTVHLPLIVRLLSSYSSL